MYVVDNLPNAGTPMLFRHGNGVYHRVIIDSGIVMTNCGRRYYLPGTRLAAIYPESLANPKSDTFDWPVISYQGQSYRCQKCR